MEAECPECEEMCDAYDEDKLLSKVVIYFECYACGIQFQRIYKYSETVKLSQMCGLLQRHKPNVVY